ncbi:MAG TPA: hypothetical protein VGR92_14330 [Steroidobacteraceae bacterium]|nr:hypothetical protein [Steroidobacteraceae bacterium]
MSMREPPTLAAWLLKTFVTAPRAESLLGDLLEEYQAGRTSGWYWRETLLALLIVARRQARELLARRAVHVFLVLSANSALVVWLFTLAQQFRQLCPAPSILLSRSIPVATYAGVIAAAVALMLWRSSLPRLMRVSRSPALLRLSVVALAAIGFSGGAVTWAGTAFCSANRAVCPSSYETTSCARRGGNTDGPQPHHSNRPNSVLARSPGGVHLPGR